VRYGGYSLSGGTGTGIVSKLKKHLKKSSRSLPKEPRTDVKSKLETWQGKVTTHQLEGKVQALLALLKYHKAW
jgi:hypothetical protein